MIKRAEPPTEKRSRAGIWREAVQRDPMVVGPPGRPTTRMLAARDPRTGLPKEDPNNPPAREPSLRGAVANPSPQAMPSGTIRPATSRSRPVEAQDVPPEPPPVDPGAPPVEPAVLDLEFELPPLEAALPAIEGPTDPGDVRAMTSLANRYAAARKAAKVAALGGRARPTSRTSSGARPGEASASGSRAMRSIDSTASTVRPTASRPAIGDAGASSAAARPTASRPATGDAGASSAAARPTASRPAIGDAGASSAAARPTASRSADPFASAPPARPPTTSRPVAPDPSASSVARPAPPPSPSVEEPAKSPSPRTDLPPSFEALAAPLSAPEAESHFLIAQVLGEPFALARSQPARIGRDPDNEVVLALTQVSRKHAILRWEGGGDGWVITDLGSANGTFVNGRAIRRRPLQDGDRIVIGPFSLVFRARTGGSNLVRGGDETDTLSTDTLGGDLSEVPVPNLVRFLAMLGKTGELVVTSPVPIPSRGTITLDQGRLLHAERAPLTGEEAFMAIVRTRHGSFRFTARAVDGIERTLHRDVDELIAAAVAGDTAPPDEPPPV